MARPRTCYIALLYGVHDDEKTVDLAVALGVSQEAAVGHLSALWLEMMSQRGSDSLDGVSELALARWGRWSGDVAIFARALRDCRWIKDRNGKPIASGWDAANGRALRELARKRRAYKRLKSGGFDGESPENIRRMDGDSPPISGVPYPTLPVPDTHVREKSTARTSRAAPAARKPAGHDRILATYGDAWATRYGHAPAIGKADRSAVGAMLRDCPADVLPAEWTDRLADLVRAYVTDDGDRYIVRAAHLLRLMPGRLPALQAARSNGVHARPRDAWSTLPRCEKHPDAYFVAGTSCPACPENS